MFQTINLTCWIRMLGKDGGKGKRKGKQGLRGQILPGNGGRLRGRARLLKPSWKSSPELGKGSVQHTDLERASRLPSGCSPLRPPISCLYREIGWAVDPWQADLDALGERVCVGLGVQEQYVCIDCTASSLSKPSPRSRLLLPVKPLRQMFPLRSDYSQLLHSPSCGRVRMCTITASPSSTNAPWGGSRLFLWELDNADLVHTSEKGQIPERPRFWDKRGKPMPSYQDAEIWRESTVPGKETEMVRSSTMWSEHKLLMGHLPL